MDGLKMENQDESSRVAVQSQGTAVGSTAKISNGDAPALRIYETIIGYRLVDQNDCDFADIPKFIGREEEQRGKAECIVMAVNANAALF